MPGGNSAHDDESTILELDRRYQKAVKENDAETMDMILAEDFVLVTGVGRVFTKRGLLDEARSGSVVYEKQEDSDQAVRISGDTAVLTARLWAKGTEKGKPFQYSLWFSDTYVRGANGWKYFFGQASTRHPADS